MLKKHLLKAFIIKAVLIGTMVFLIGTTYYTNVNEVTDKVSHNTKNSGEFLIGKNIVYAPALGDQLSPTVAFDGTNYLVVWVDNRSDSAEVYGARVDQSGNVLDTTGIFISTAVGDIRSPTISFGETNYLVVWSALRILHFYEIYGIRLDQSGSVLDTTNITFQSTLPYHGSPAVAFDGINYMVVWTGWSFDIPFIVSARVEQSGNVLDTLGNRISEYAFGPAIAFGNTNYLVVWTDEYVAYDIYGARVDTSGIAIDTNKVPISTAEHYQVFPSVAFDGYFYLVVWEEERSGTDEDIYGARVFSNDELIVIDPDGFTISAATNKQSNPKVAFGDTNYLVVWDDCRNDSLPDIYGALVHKWGAIPDTIGISISTAIDKQSNPAVAFDGTNYLVVWQDKRSGLDYDIYGARVDTSGNVLDPEGFLISSSTAGIEEDEDFIPTSFGLMQNYPNPFSRKTNINYTLPKASEVSLEVYDITGRLVITLIDGFQNAGVYEVTFDGSKLVPGIYFYHLKAGEFIETKKMILIK